MKLYEIFGNKDKHYAMNDVDMASGLNPDSTEYRDNEEALAKKTYSPTGTNIVTKDEDNGEEVWTTDPRDDEWQSPGYRGQQEAKERSGVAHKKYQKYDPSYVAQETPSDLGALYP